MTPDPQSGVDRHKANTGAKMTAGTLKTGGSLCETALYFNANDHDGNPTQCGDNDATFGPSWNAKNNNGCPFDDPSTSGSFGPRNGGTWNEYNARGFGWALALNKGSSGSGQNNVRLYVR